MVESNMDHLVNRLKPLIQSWTQQGKEECVDLIIESWSENDWTSEELATCENYLQVAFYSTNAYDAAIESRLGNLFSSFE